MAASAAMRYNTALEYAASRTNYLGGQGLLYLKKSKPFMNILKGSAVHKTSPKVLGGTWMGPCSKELYPKRRQHAVELAIRQITETNPRAKWQRARDFLLYVLIGVLVAVFGILYGVHQADTKQTPGLPTKWLGFAIMTGLIFLNAIRSYRRSWGQRKYWVLLFFFAVVHFAAGIAVVSRLQNGGSTQLCLRNPHRVFRFNSVFRPLPES